MQHRGPGAYSLDKHSAKAQSSGAQCGGQCWQKERKQGFTEGVLGEWEKEAVECTQGRVNKGMERWRGAGSSAASETDCNKEHLPIQVSLALLSALPNKQCLRSQSHLITWLMMIGSGGMSKACSL